jgi:hypothetical protein
MCCDISFSPDRDDVMRPARTSTCGVGRNRVRTAAGVLVAVVLAAVPLAGCGDRQKDAAPDPNLIPADYREQLLTFLKTYLGSGAGVVRDATIAPPALKPFGSESRYVVCVRYNDGEGNHEKMAVYFSGSINQFIDPTAGQCSGAAYQPFPELQGLGAKAGTIRR